jgi:hypothetical protein
VLVVVHFGERALSPETWRPNAGGPRNGGNELTETCPDRDWDGLHVTMY